MLDDMRVFDEVARQGSLTRAADVLAMPKQTVSRRLAALEARLGVQLVQRTTRRMRLTDAGAAYARACATTLQLAREADEAAREGGASPSGTLRVASDPLFGETFVAPIVNEYLKAHPRVEVELVLSQRHVHPVEEGFDVAFLVGQVEDASLEVHPLGPARIRYCASPAYLAARGAPQRPRDLASHECVDLATREDPFLWPFRERGRVAWRRVRGRARLGSFALLRRAALDGVGIAVLPAFACADDVRAGRLVPVLDEFVPDVGSVLLVTPRQRFPSARVARFVALARERLEGHPGWVVPEPRRSGKA